MIFGFKKAKKIFPDFFRIKLRGHNNNLNFKTTNVEKSLSETYISVLMKFCFILFRLNAFVLLCVLCVSLFNCSNQISSVSIKVLGIDTVWSEEKNSNVIFKWKFHKETQGFSIGSQVRILNDLDYTSVLIEDAMNNGILDDTVFEASGLRENTAYIFSFIVLLDKYTSDTVKLEVLYSPTDLIPPAFVSNLVIDTANLTLIWKDPPDEDLAGIIVCYGGSNEHGIIIPNDTVEPKIQGYVLLDNIISIDTFTLVIRTIDYSNNESADSSYFVRNPHFQP